MLSQYPMEMLLKLVLITICNNLIVNASTTNTAAAGNNGEDKI